MNSILIMTRFAVVFVLLAGCGSSTVDPLRLATGFNGSNPTLGPVTSTGTLSVSNITQSYTVANPYWGIFSNGGFTGFGSYIAPADGIVTQIGVATLNGTTFNFVTIVHSGHLATRLYGVQSVLIRSGDAVTQGQTVGTFYSLNNFVYFQVLLDGSPVCPLSYLSDSFRATLVTNTWQPCQ